MSLERDYKQIQDKNSKEVDYKDESDSELTKSEEDYFFTFILILYKKDRELQQFIIETETTNLVESLQKQVDVNTTFISDRVEELPQGGGVEVKYFFLVFILFMYSMLRIDAAVFTMNKMRTTGRIDQLKKIVNNDIIKKIANAESTELVNRVTNIDGLINDVTEAIGNIKENILSSETVSSAINVVSDLGLIDHDIFNVIKHGKDVVNHLKAIQNKEYDLTPENIIGTVDTFCELGQLSLKYLAKNVGPKNIFSKILEINTTGHYVVASQVLWKIHTHAMDTASTFSTQDRQELMFNPDTSPILFERDIIKDFTVNNIKTLNSAINKARDRILSKIEKENPAGLFKIGGRPRKTLKKRRNKKHRKNKNKTKQKRKI